MPAPRARPTLPLAIERKETRGMPKVSKDSAAQVDDHGPVEDRHEDVNGYTVNFVSFRQDIDATPLLRGLPDDSCSAGPRAPTFWSIGLGGGATWTARSASRSSSRLSVRS
jgi:hypothetical protein